VALFERAKCGGFHGACNFGRAAGRVRQNTDDELMIVSGACQSEINAYYFRGTCDPSPRPNTECFWMNENVFFG
jgi:hypothetical protein